MKRGREFYRLKAGRRDANHAAIRDGLRKLGYFVVDTASVGDGVPDLCVYPRNTHLGFTHFEPRWLEIKMPGRTRKTALGFLQQKWRRDAEFRGVHVRTVRTLDEALEALR